MTGMSTLELDSVEKWGLFFTAASNEAQRDLLEQLKKTDEGINMASTLLERISQDEKERAIIFEREKILTDYYAGLAYAEQKGEKEGFKQGIEQGIEQGKQNVAAAMKEQGFPLEQICRLTGLSTEEVESL